MEPTLARSTYCRTCSQHFEIGVSVHKPAPAPVAATSEESGFWGRITGIFRDNSPRKVCCFDCGTRQEVLRTATSGSCKSCGAYIDFEDFKIVGAFSRTVRTAGNIFVTSKGDMSSIDLICGSAEIEGMMRGNLVCTGEVSVKYKGRIPGGIETDTLRVLKRSQAEFVRPVRARQVFVEGDMSGRILASGTVHISKTGRLTGSVFALGFTVEKGGVFAGDLSIGQHEAEQPDLLPATRIKRAARAVDERQRELGFGTT